MNGRITRDPKLLFGKVPCRESTYSSVSPRDFFLSFFSSFLTEMPVVNLLFGPVSFSLGCLHAYTSLILSTTTISG